MAVIGVTAKLEYQSGSGWVEVVNPKSVNFPGFTVSSIDTTNLSIANYGMQFMPGMIDAGSVTFEAEYTDDNYNGLNALVREIVGWRVTAPDDGDGAVVVTCSGFLTKLDVNMTPNEEVMISGEVKMTGLPSVA